MRRTGLWASTMLATTLLITGCDEESTGSTCGDGVVEGAEVCDGSDLQGATCVGLDQGFVGGQLACSSGCDGWDTSGCVEAGQCGNDVLENTTDSTELCDGLDLGGMTCEGLGWGFTTGALQCNATCDGWDVSGCENELCGNEQIDANEPCDGTRLDNHSCLAEGFDGGTLACNATCTGWDTTGCLPDTCGNGTIDLGESCDSNNLGDATCSDLTPLYTGGSLVCGWCEFITQSCTGLDRSEEPPWPCEGNNFVYPMKLELDHWMAMRMVLPATPFTVERVEYYLANTAINNGTEDIFCDASLNHEAGVFVSADATPPASPDFVRQWTAPGAVTSTRHHLVGHDLDQPVTVQPGEHLFLAVRNAGEWPRITCWETCNDVEAGDRTWWSNDGAPPYPWNTLGQWNINGTWRAVALGHP